MNILYSPFKLKNLELKNRFVRSATYDGLADNNNRVSDEQIEFFSNLASGGVGLIITGIGYVHHTSQVSLTANSIDSDEFIPGYQKLTKAVHESGAKIALQLYHGGREARFVKTRNILPLAPSVIENDPYFKETEYREIKDSEIWEIINAFGDGARRAKEAGFDAVQVHGAHAYFISQFLSPFTNRRKDQWGGSLENRLRLHCDIYKDIRKKVGENYPVFIKIGVEDGFSGGLEFKEGKQAAKLLADIGFDSLEISGGIRGKYYEGTEFKPYINSIDKEAYYRSWYQELKNQINVPIMMVGGLRTPALMKEIIENGEADLVSLCRPLIWEPGLINEWKTDEQKKPKCISCNKCFDAIHTGQKLYCRVLEKEQVG